MRVVSGRHHGHEEKSVSQSCVSRAADAGWHPDAGAGLFLHRVESRVGGPLAGGKAVGHNAKLGEKPHRRRGTHTGDAEHQLVSPKEGFFRLDNCHRRLAHSLDAALVVLDVGEHILLHAAGAASAGPQGVQPVLDAVLSYLPSPEELPPIPAVHGKKNEEIEIPRTEKENLSALIFKIQHDREMGMLCYLRVYSGIIKSGTAVLNVNGKKRERVNRLLRMHANHHEQISELRAGDIGVAIGMKFARTGETLASEGYPVILENMEFPEPVISVAIEPKTMSDQSKLKNALDNLRREDPTFAVKENDETGQLIISGMGELHLDVLVTRVLEEYKVEANVGKPQVTYRESITKAVSHSETYQRTLAGKEHAATITLQVEPRDRGEGNYFESSLSTGKLPANFQEAVRRGIEASFPSGIVMGYPAVDVKVTLTGVVFQELTASEIAFEAASSLGYDAACRKASPVLLEPIMEVDVMCPSEQVGDVISNLSQRGGHVDSMESRPSYELVKAKAPLVNMFGYSTTLRSLTQGRGTFSMEFSHFATKTS